MATSVTVPMVGKIVSVSVKVGDKVKEDDQVAVIGSHEDGDASRGSGKRSGKRDLRLCRSGGGGGGDHCRD